MVGRPPSTRPGVGGRFVYNGSRGGGLGRCEEKGSAPKENREAEPDHPERPLEPTPLAAGSGHITKPGAYGKPDGGLRARESDDRYHTPVKERCDRGHSSHQDVDREGREVEGPVGGEADGLKSARGTHEESRGAT
ncbi:hypothetical protein ACSQ67_003329 [Phaseolus vulgaris]